MKTELGKAMERRKYELKVLKSLRKTLKLSRFGLTYWRIKKDVKYFDTFLLDVLTAQRRLKDIKELEFWVNQYVKMDYTTYMIAVDPLEYRIGEGKRVFLKLHYDSQNNRESEPLFVGS